MAYIAEEIGIKIIKKEMSKGIFRDILKVDCKECHREFEHELSNKITCPFCNDVIEKVK